jgi:hypothetical protein
MNNNTVKKIIVDITVANCQIRAARPKHQHIPMPTLEAEKFLFWNTVDLKRLNERDYGTLRGNALIKARQLVNREGVWKYQDLNQILFHIRYINITIRPFWPIYSKQIMFHKSGTFT